MKLANSISPTLSRRRFLGRTAALTAAGLLGTWHDSACAEISSLKPANGARYKIGVCDWMILKRQKLGAFALAHEIGTDGVEVDMGSLGDRPSFDDHLLDTQVRRQFLAEARAQGLEICSLAMSGFYSQSFADRPTSLNMAQECLTMMAAMNVKTAFLPLGVRGDLLKHPEMRPKIVERLKAIAPAAETAGVVIGIETTLSAGDEVKLLAEIGSPSIRSYFNFANALQAGRDLTAELRILGRDRLAQIHCTNVDRFWLQNDPQVHLPRVRQTLDEMGWSGWLVLERSRDIKDVHNVKKNYGANAAYLKSIFQSS